MRAYGSDRVRVDADGTILLSCRVPKEGWTARNEATRTRSEHPGSAIHWDDEWYEVAAAEELSQGVRYTLVPWRDEHAMRTTFAYDEASEHARSAARADSFRRRKNRRLATFLGFATGHLPAEVQQRIEDESGARAPLLTFMSVVPEFLFTLWTVNAWASARVAGTKQPDPFLLFLAGYFALDTLMRGLAIAWLQSRPGGSLIGFVAYSIYYALHPNRKQLIPPVQRDRPMFIEGVTPEQTATDTMHVIEPLLTLLSRRDQEYLARRYGYDYRSTAVSTAAVLLVFALAGVGTSVHTLTVAPRVSALVALAVAAFLALEQVVRMLALRTGPAGSVLQFLARPLARKLL